MECLRLDTCILFLHTHMLQAFQPDGSSVVTGSKEGALHTYALPTQCEIQELPKSAKRKREQAPALNLHKQASTSNLVPPGLTSVVTALS